MTDEEKLNKAENAAAHAAIEAYTNVFANSLQESGIEKPLTRLAGTSHVHHSLAIEGKEHVVVRLLVTFSNDPALIEQLLARVPKEGSA